MGKHQHGDILARFGAKIRRLRADREQSQEKFAFDCGLDRTYLSGIERGERNVSLRNLEVIAKALGLSLAELFKDV